MLFVAFCLVASILGPVGSPAADAQSQTSWYVNDDPELFGPSRYWWAGDTGKGYGSNNYVYTYGIAGESSADNWARWSMGSRVGRQEIEAYVPNTRATATVVYRIDVGGSSYTKRIVQRTAYGWTSLGTYNADGASVSIRLRDNDASQHWSRDGYSSSSIGVDAVRMRCVARCSATQPTPVPTATPAAQKEEPSAPRGVRASADADSVSVSWSAPSDDGGAAVTGYRVDLYRGSTRVGRKNTSASARSASFAGLPADTAYQVRVSAQNSAGRGPVATVSVRTSRAVRPPGSPGVAGAVVYVDSIEVVWSAPSDDGGAAVTGYRVDLYRGSTRVDTKKVSASAREVTFGGLSADTAYEFRISARNSAGIGAEAVGNTRTIPLPKNKPSAPRGVRASADADSVSVSWSAPSDDGGAAVTGYRVDLYRGSTRVGRKNTSASARSASFAGLPADTAYQVRVSAQNSAGRGPVATASALTDQRPGQGASLPPAGNANGQVHSVYVHLCSDSSAGYSDADLQRQVANLNSRGISDFFYKESGGLAQFHFVKGIVHHENMEGATTVKQLHDRVRTNPHPCHVEAKSLSESQNRQILMLVDVNPTSAAWGYAMQAVDPHAGGYTDSGIAFVPTLNKFTKNLSQGQYDVIVAHELGHSVFSLIHTSDHTINGKRFSGGAPEVRGSLMNWTFRGVAGLGDVRVFCVNRMRAQWSCDPSKPDPFLDAEPVVVITAPSSPRSVVAVAHGEGQIRVSWSPPSDDGGTAITGYRVDLYRGANRLDRKSVPASARSASFSGFGADTSYRVNITAQNLAGGSPEATTNVRTDAAAVETERETADYDRDAPPKTETVKIEFPNYRWSSYSSTYWEKVGGECSRAFGCTLFSEPTATTTKAKRSVWWNMGDIQGVFTFSRKLLTDVHDDPRQSLTGRVLWRIYEKRSGDSEFQLVKIFRPASQKGKSGWWTYNGTRIELDGEVRIQATNRDDGKRVAVQKVRLNHVDVLPEHKRAAIVLCRVDVGNFYKLSKPDILVLAIDGVGLAEAARTLAAKGSAGLSLGSKIALGAAAFGLGWYGGWALFEVAWPGITHRSARDLAYNCRYFKYNVFYGLGVVKGYGDFADDIAEWTANGRTVPLSNDPNDAVTFERRLP